MNDAIVRDTKAMEQFNLEFQKLFEDVCQAYLNILDCYGQLETGQIVTLTGPIVSAMKSARTLMTEQLVSLNKIPDAIDTEIEHSVSQLNQNTSTTQEGIMQATSENSGGTP